MGVRNGGVANQGQSRTTPAYIHTQAQAQSTGAPAPTAATLSGTVNYHEERISKLEHLVHGLIEEMGMLRGGLGV